LSQEGIGALEKICAIWEPAVAAFAAGKTPLQFSEGELRELRGAIATAELWLRGNFPRAFP
jgi:hypothetical protein